MTYEDIVDALKEKITADTGFPVLILPQNATNNTAHIELLFQDLEQNGENNEKLTINAEYKTSGTHKKWLTQTIKLKRILKGFSENCMDFVCKGENLRAYWQSRMEPQWVYPQDNEGAMPEAYVMAYMIEVDIPSRFIDTEE